VGRTILLCLVILGQPSEVQLSALAELQRGVVHSLIGGLYDIYRMQYFIVCNN
jgi:hypothetical protein